MDNQGWIKLYRKIGDHEIMRDAYGLQIFIWLLIHVDRMTGQYTSGRFVMSEALKIKPRTLHKVVTERLQNRYHLVTLLSDNKKTTFSICKWKSYQENSDTKSDTKVTPEGQQSDTKQEVRSKKEYIISKADSSFTGNLFGTEIKKPVSTTRWQQMALDYSKKFGFEPSASWFKFFKNGDEGKLQDTYAKMFGLTPNDPEKYFYKLYGGNYAPDTTK